MTQIGGFVYLLSAVISKKWNKKLKYKTLIIFTSLYFFSTFLIVPLISPVFGREKVKHSEKIKPTNYMTVLLNRNYVRPKLNDLLSNTAKKLNGTNITIQRGGVASDATMSFEGRSAHAVGEGQIRKLLAAYTSYVSMDSTDKASSGVMDANDK